MKKTSLLLAALLLAPAADALAWNYEGFQSFQVYYSNTPWFRGTANGWGKAALVAATAYKYNGITYVGYINIPAGTQSFKIDTSTNGDWTSNFGDNWLGDTCMDAGGGNIPLTLGAGTYEIRYSTGAAGYGCGRPFYSVNRLNTYTAVQRSMYLRTSFNSWLPLPMYLVRNNVWEAPITAPKNTFGDFKIDVKGDWSLNYGRTGIDPRTSGNVGRATQGGPNIQMYLEDYDPNTTQVTRMVRFNDSTLEYAVCPNASTTLCN